MPDQGPGDRQQAADPPEGPLRLRARRRGARADRRRPRGRARPRAVRRDRRPGRGLPHPPGPPVHPAGSQRRPRPPRRRARARGLARRAQRGRLAVPRGVQRRRPDRHGLAQGRAGHAPSAVGHRAPARAVRRRGRQGQRRGVRVRGDRGRRDPQGQVPRAGPAGRAARRRPDRGPIPLADATVGAAAAVGAGAAKARDAAGTGIQRSVWRIQDLLPRRRTRTRKVTAATSRMETQRRAAFALLAFIAAASALVVGVYAVGGQPGSPANRSARSPWPSGRSRPPRRPSPR